MWVPFPGIEIQYGKKGLFLPVASKLDFEAELLFLAKEGASLIY